MSWRKRLKPKERMYKKWIHQGCYTPTGYTRKYNRGLGVRVYYYKDIIADENSEREKAFYRLPHHIYERFSDVLTVIK